MFFLFIYRNQLEHVDISADEIRNLKHLGMIDFEERVWKALGQKYINHEDRRRVNIMFLLLLTCEGYRVLANCLILEKSAKDRKSWSSLLCVFFFFLGGKKSFCLSKSVMSACAFFILFHFHFLADSRMHALLVCPHIIYMSLGLFGCVLLGSRSTNQEISNKAGERERVLT